MAQIFRNPLVPLLTMLTAVGSSTYYNDRWHRFAHEEHEARMDELEGTLRGHIGLIEEALDRLEGKAKEEDRGKKTDEYYNKRGRDEKEKK